MTWALAGYFPKRRKTRAQWVSPHADYPNAPFPWAAPVEEICSASRCIADGPDGWRNVSGRNLFNLYDSPELAWSIVPGPERASFDMFAYRLLLLRFEDGQQEPLDVWWEPAAESISRSFVRLGWDAVEESIGCSPLSCNVGADIVNVLPVNRYCLADSEQDGIELARSFSRSKPEPGPYCVMEVWRDQGPASLLHG